MHYSERRLQAGRSAPEEHRGGPLSYKVECYGGRFAVGHAQQLAG
jgi:hypothetical protein